MFSSWRVTCPDVDTHFALRISRKKDRKTWNKLYKLHETAMFDPQEGINHGLSRCHQSLVGLFHLHFFRSQRWSEKVWEKPHHLHGGFNPSARYASNCIISPSLEEYSITLTCLSMVHAACKNNRKACQEWLGLGNIAQSKAPVSFARVSGDWFLHDQNSAGIFFPGKVGGLSIIPHQDAIAESEGCIWDPYKPWKLIPKTWYIDTS